LFREFGASGESQAATEPKNIVTDILERAKTRIAQRRAGLKRGARTSDEPEGEERSKVLARAALVDIEKISEDKEFANTRLNDEPFYPDQPGTQGQSLESLAQSMREEGLKVPITVIARWGRDDYYIRAGFRRLKSAQKLEWKQIPAIVLSADTPTSDQYWCNVLENSTRKSLTTYEVGNAAKLMRDKFGVKPADFAKKTGYSYDYVRHLIVCFDRLSDQLLEQWKLGARLTVAEWYKLAQCDHHQALRMFRQWSGTGVSERMKEIEKNRTHKRQLAPVKWLERMQRLYTGIDGSRLEPKTRQLCLQVVEFCMGQRHEIKDVYDPSSRRSNEKRAEMRRTLKLRDLPEPDDPPVENDEPSPPVIDDDDNDAEEDDPIR